MASKIYLPFVALALTLLAACGSTGGLERPQSFDEYVLVAYNATSTAYDTIAVLATAGKLDQAAALKAIAQIDEQYAQIGVARSLRSTSPGDAQTLLQKTILALQVLNAALSAQQGASP